MYGVGIYIYVLCTNIHSISVGCLHLWSLHEWWLTVETSHNPGLKGPNGKTSTEYGVLRMCNAPDRMVGAHNVVQSIQTREYSAEILACTQRRKNSCTPCLTWNKDLDRRLPDFPAVWPALGGVLASTRYYIGVQARLDSRDISTCKMMPWTLMHGSDSCQ